MPRLPRRTTVDRAAAVIAAGRLRIATPKPDIFGATPAAWSLPPPPTTSSLSENGWRSMGVPTRQDAARENPFFWSGPETIFGPAWNILACGGHASRTFPHSSSSRGIGAGTIFPLLRSRGSAASRSERSSTGPPMYRLRMRWQTMRGVP